ncbi:MAG TPA: hypothetical protein VGA35_12305 [bacterium]
MDRVVITQVLRRARAATAAFAGPPPVSLERVAGRLGIAEIRRVELVGGGAGARLEEADGRRVLAVDRRIPPRTPQWNGLVALTLARTLLPSGSGGEGADDLIEIGAAELLLPARVFTPVAARTDLTMDGLRDLALRFAAPIRLTVRQWLLTRTWTGFALLWRPDGGGLRLGWRAASPGLQFPAPAAIGAPAGAIWSAQSRLHATVRTGRPHHGVEEVQSGAGAAWWFTRFGVVRDLGRRSVLALVVLDRRGPESPRRRPAEGNAAWPEKRRPAAGRSGAPVGAGRPS